MPYGVLYVHVLHRVKAMDEIAQALSPEGRVHVVYFEALKRALPSEIQRLADFLKLDCTQTKLDAVARAVGRWRINLLSPRMCSRTLMSASSSLKMGCGEEEASPSVSSRGS